jgi:hypothetical protein
LGVVLGADEGVGMNRSARRRALEAAFDPTRYVNPLQLEMRRIAQFKIRRHPDRHRKVFIWEAMDFELERRPQVKAAAEAAERDGGGEG